MRKVLLVAIIICFAGMILAEEAVKPILEKGDVERFIKTFPGLKEDLKQFGMQVNGETGTITYPMAVQKQKEYFNILKKHGWDQSYHIKSMTIVRIYANVKYGKQASEADKEIQKAIKELDNNTALSPEMRKQLKQQMLAAKGMMNQQATHWNKKIHEKDKSLVAPHIKALTKVIEAE